MTSSECHNERWVRHLVKEVLSAVNSLVADMFSSLVPVQVHSAMASYDARKAEVINMETGRLREYTQIMNGFVIRLLFLSHIHKGHSGIAQPLILYTLTTCVAYCSPVNCFFG